VKFVNQLADQAEIPFQHLIHHFNFVVDMNQEVVVFETVPRKKIA